jgi:hypothetical protein
VLRGSLAVSIAILTLVLCRERFGPEDPAYVHDGDNLAAEWTVDFFSLPVRRISDHRCRERPLALWAFLNSISASHRIAPSMFCLPTRSQG